MMRALASCCSSQGWRDVRNDLDPKIAPFGIGPVAWLTKRPQTGDHEWFGDSIRCSGKDTGAHNPLEDADLLDFADHSGEQLLGQLGALDPAWQDRLVRRAAPVAGPPVTHQGGHGKGTHIPIKFSYRNLGTLSGDLLQLVYFGHNM